MGLNFPTNGRRDPLKNRGSRAEVRESDSAMTASGTAHPN
jgi:hypothetical protein